MSLTTDFDEHEQSAQRFLVKTGFDRYINLGIGDNNPYYHKFILYGQRVRGLELTSSSPSDLLHLDCVIGNTRSARQPYIYDAEGLQTAAADGSLSHNDSISYFNEGVYRRVLGMGRLHVGNGSPVTVGISFLKAKDNSNSISQVYMLDDETEKKSQKGDSPKDNVVFGFDFALTVLRRRLQFFADASLSAVTDNTALGVLTSEEIAELAGSSDVLPIDLENIENFLVVNASTLPLPSGGGVANSAAYDAGVKLTMPIGPVQEKFMFSYTTVGSNYRSLGYESLEFNKREFSFLEEVGLLQNRINLQARFDIYRDNLDKYKPEPTWTRALTLSGNIYIDPRFPSAFITFGNNFSENTSPDSSRLDMLNTSNNLGIQTSYTRALGSTKNTLSLGYNRLGYLATSSRMIDEYGDRDSAQLLTNLGSILLRTDYGILPFSTRLGFSANIASGDAPARIFSPSLGTTIRIIPEKLTFNTDIQMQRLLDDDSEPPSNGLIGKANVSFTPAATHSFYLNGSGTYKRDQYEGYGGLTYELRF
jgi:hypothetical protein